MDRELMADERLRNHEDPEVLCRRAQAGDEESFGQLVHLYQKKVFCLAFSVLRNREDALDVVQETFMKVYKSLASYETGRNFESWLLRVAKNVAIDHYRRSRAKSQRREEKLPLSSVEVQRASFNEDYNQAQMKQAVEAALTRLAERQRLVFMLRHFQGFSYEEIAAILGVALGTAKSLHFKALQKMKSLVRQSLEEGA